MMIPTRWTHLVAVCLTLAIAAGVPAQEIDISVLQFGVGSSYRAGETTGMQLELTSRLPEPMQVWVQWGVPNADGDIAEYGRSLALTPGRATPVWLYAPLPPPPKQLNNSTIWTVRVFEERDGRRRSELAAARVSPALANANLVPIESSMIAVIGSSSMGLDGYDVNAPMGQPRPIAANEATRIVRGITPNMLPDRWDGLKGFEAVVWYSGTSEGNPRDLRADQATALKQYVQHGGHLIIDLPQVGDPWSLGMGGQNELDEILPARSLDKVPRRDESVKLSSMLPMLSKSRPIPRDIEMSIRVFKDLNGTFDVIDNYYEPLIALPDGRVVVIRRTYGHGHITVIGMELSRQVTAMGVPQGDRFWNRILGRRIDTPTATEVMAMQEAKRLSRTEITVLAGSGTAVEQMISLTGEASRALLLALVLFGAYWLLAGPLGFAILKRQKLAQHSWVAFLVATALFTAIAWGSVSLLRAKDISVKHVTFLDYIARPDGERADDPQLARAVSWLSVYLNKYGPVQMGLVPVENQRNLLQSWPAPRRENQPFPNIDQYPVDVGRDPTQFSIAARSTTSQFYANYLGPLDRKWGGMIVADPDNPVTATITRDGREDRLTGVLRHELSGPLSNVIVIWIKNDRPSPRDYQRDGESKYFDWISPGDIRLLNNGSAWIIPTWLPDSPLDLETQLFGATGQRGTPAESLSLYLERRYKDEFDSDMAITRIDSTLSVDRIRLFFEMLSMYSMLKPPEYLVQPQQTKEPVVVTRDLGRELDLGIWFTRPCVIIIGRLENSTSPVPLRVEGTEHETSGVTYVRWIYPLPVEDEIAFSDVLSKDDARDLRVPVTPVAP